MLFFMLDQINDINSSEYFQERISKITEDSTFKIKTTIINDKLTKLNLDANLYLVDKNNTFGILNISVDKNSLLPAFSFTLGANNPKSDQIVYLGKSRLNLGQLIYLNDKAVYDPITASQSIWFKLNKDLAPINFYIKGSRKNLIDQLSISVKDTFYNNSVFKNVRIKPDFKLYGNDNTIEFNAKLKVDCEEFPFLDGRFGFRVDSNFKLAQDNLSRKEYNKFDPYYKLILKGDLFINKVIPFCLSGLFIKQTFSDLKKYRTQTEFGAQFVIPLNSKFKINLAKEYSFKGNIVLEWSNTIDFKNSKFKLFFKLEKKNDYD